MKRVRHEVHNFGISGFTPGKRKKAKMDILIEMGAKPLKPMPINYKKLQRQRLKEKRKTEELVNIF